MTQQAKQPKNIQPVVKEAARIEDRPITMAPRADIERARNFFQDKMQKQEARARLRLAAGKAANQPTDEEIVAAVHAASAMGQVTLTFVDGKGVERPTQILSLILKKLRDE